MNYEFCKFLVFLQASETQTWPTYEQTDAKVEIVIKKWAKAMFDLYYLDQELLAPLCSA